jgi:hypothetical protein
MAGLGRGGTGLHAQLDSDFMGLAPVALVKPVEHAQDLLRPIAPLTCPLAEGVTALAELFFDLLWGHCGHSYVN